MKRHIFTAVPKLQRGTSKTTRKKLQDYKRKRQNQESKSSLQKKKKKWRKKKKRIEISKAQNLKGKNKNASYFTAYQTTGNKEKGFMLRI